MSKRKKIAATLLTMLMFFSMLPSMAYAEEQPAASAKMTVVRHGTDVSSVTENPTARSEENGIELQNSAVDTSWYDGQKTEYDINSAEALAGVSELAAGGNTFAGITLNLTADVDLSGYQPWIPIEEFQGTFNGGGHKVSNMYVEQNAGQSGLFGYLHYATVRDLVVDQAEVIVPESNTHFYQGILAGWALGATVENCGTTGSITVNIGENGDGPHIGGLIGSCKVVDSLRNCWSMADVKTTNPNKDAMLGGLVGQWEDAAAGAEIIDCYFGGTIEAAEATSPASGILGGALSFNGEVVLVSGCVSYGQITTPADSKGSAVHIVMLDEDGKAENCMWPDDGKPGVVRLLIVWNGNVGYADPDPDFDETVCGQRVSDFTDPEVIETLNAHAQTKNLWALGLNGYPVFSTQTDLIRADYSAVDAAKAKVPGDLSLYTDETAGVLQDLLASIDENMSMEQQEEVNEMAEALEAAIVALEYKDADYSKVDAAIEKAEELNKDDYKDFSAVEAAVNAVVRGKKITEQKAVDEMAEAIEDAITGLEKKPLEEKEPIEDKKEDTEQESYVPNTGDDVRIYNWMFLVAVSGMISAGMVIYIRNKKNNR